MGKVKVTQEMGKVLDELKKTNENVIAYIVNIHSSKVEYKSQYKILRDLTASELAIALYGDGYEIESEFNVGDKVVFVYNTHFRGGEKILTVMNTENDEYAAQLTNGLYYKAESIRLATQEEIYWYETLGREFVGDFREDDVVITSGVSYRCSMDNEIDSISIDEAKEWMEKGVINKIHPVEFSKPYPQKETE